MYTCLCFDGDPQLTLFLHLRWTLLMRFWKLRYYLVHLFASVIQHSVICVRKIIKNAKLCCDCGEGEVQTQIGS